MSTNPWFSDYYRPNGKDQQLLNALTVECIKNKGRDLFYIPRELVALDKIYGEDKLSAFSQYFVLEMYLEDFSGFGGQRELVSHFGFEVRDEIKLQVSKTRFNDEVMRARPDILRPREGDLLFFPLDESLFQISFVENEENFYALGKIFTYLLSATRFDLAHETLATGVEAIDDVATKHAVHTQINLASGTGTFSPAEIVFQGSSLATATFLAEVVMQTGDVLLVVNTKNELNLALPLNGFTSGASWTLDPATDGEPSQLAPEAIVAAQNEVLDAENVDKSVVVSDPRNPLAW